MSVTFSPVLSAEIWMAQPDQLVCIRTEEVIQILPTDWREILKTRDQLEALCRNHCDDCLQYGPQVQRKAPEGYTELNVNNHNASRILLVLGLAAKYTEGDHTYIELSGSVTTEKFEQALLIADLAGNPVHRASELREVLDSARLLNCTAIQYA